MYVYNLHTYRIFELYIEEKNVITKLNLNLTLTLYVTNSIYIYKFSLFH